MKLADVHRMISAGGVPYASIRDQIVPGDLLFLHDEFAPSWYGIQVGAVELFTGPFAHVGVLDRVTLGGRDRVVVYEAVVPHPRAVTISATADEGFFWVPLNKPMTDAERNAAWAEFGVHEHEYSKAGAIAAGLKLLPDDEAQDPRRWCSKAAELWRNLSGVNLGGSYVPTPMAQFAMDHYGARPIYVSTSKDC